MATNYPNLTAWADRFSKRQPIIRPASVIRKSEKATKFSGLFVLGKYLE
jgi:hypothetical protein